jgi:hypothetical protein
MRARSRRARAIPGPSDDRRTRPHKETSMGVIGLLVALILLVILLRLIA